MRVIRVFDIACPACGGELRVCDCHTEGEGLFDYQCPTVYCATDITHVFRTPDPHEVGTVAGGRLIPGKTDECEGLDEAERTM